MSEVTRILSAIEQGDPRAAEQLLPLVYDELRRLAAQKLARETPGKRCKRRLSFMRRISAWSAVRRRRRRRRGTAAGHFFAAAAEAMRRILVDQARHKRTAKAGGDRQRIGLSDIESPVPEPDVDLLALHDALDKLEAADKRKAELVKLRFFVGLTIEEAAHALGVSISTATNDWAYARCWLRLEVLGVRDLKAT